MRVLDEDGVVVLVVEEDGVNVVVVVLVVVEILVELGVEEGESVAGIVVKLTLVEGPRGALDVSIPGLLV